MRGPHSRTADIEVILRRAAERFSINVTLCMRENDHIPLLPELKKQIQSILSTAFPNGTSEYMSIKSQGSRYLTGVEITAVAPRERAGEDIREDIFAALSKIFALLYSYHFHFDFTTYED
jgi:hypothetical protein